MNKLRHGRGGQCYVDLQTGSLVSAKTVDYATIRLTTIAIVLPGHMDSVEKSVGQHWVQLKCHTNGILITVISL